MTNNSVYTDPESGRIVMARAIEIACINGRAAIHLSMADWLEAKRELTGGVE